MKKIFTLLTVLSLCFILQAQTTKTINHGGTDRQYLEYVPSSYNASTPAPVLFVLHGLGDDMANMFNASGFRSIANQHGWIIVTPQALEANISLLGQTMSIGTAWNSGVSASLLGNNIVINDGVDDSGLMMAILDDLIANYNVDQSKVYVTGFSMGGFMANRLAIEHGDRITAIASVSGTIGNEVKETAPTGHVSAMHIHGTGDGTVGYENAAFNVVVTSVSVGLGAEATVDFWRNHNHCSATPTVTNFPDIANDSLTFEKYVYEGGDNGTKTAFIKVNGGDHTWYYTPENDIDYTTEIYNFFAGTASGIDENDNTVSIFPNPANNVLNVRGENIEQVRIYNAMGQQVVSTSAQRINVSQLSRGLYVVSALMKNGQSVNEKITIW
ncbi:MAG: T9SS type A sorting domain-containing protein [Bacteroidales bacterium]|nr:T9SS type A sorting domain-containing protein [Bacteroidales bacterium]